MQARLLAFALVCCCAAVDNADAVRDDIVVDLIETPQPAHSTATGSRLIGGMAANLPNGEPAMEIKWKDGFRLVSKDENFAITIGGRTHFDVVWLRAPDNVQFGGAFPTGPIVDGAGFRRARIDLDGVLYGNVEWKAQFEFFSTVNLDPTTDTINTELPNNRIANVTTPTDLWIGINELPLVGTVRVGNQKEPIGFEHLVSSRFLPFLERSFNQDAFTGPFNGGFSPGIMMLRQSENERSTWSIGGFNNVQGQYGFDNDRGGLATTSRVTWLPVDECDGKRLLHLGMAASHRDLLNGQVNVRARSSLRPGPSARLPVLARTAAINGSQENQLAAELAGVLGRWTLQSDYLWNWVESDTNGVLFFHGGYVQLLCFLTGEHERYDRKSAVFTRVVPNENFAMRPRSEGSGVNGWGAWQAGARFSYLDINAGGINGGILYGITLGLNWILNPNTRWQINYDATIRNVTNGANDGTVQGVGTRFAIDF